MDLGNGTVVTVTQAVMMVAIFNNASWDLLKTVDWAAVSAETGHTSSKSARDTFTKRCGRKGWLEGGVTILPAGGGRGARGASGASGATVAPAATPAAAPPAGPPAAVPAVAPAINAVPATGPTTTLAPALPAAAAPAPVPAPASLPAPAPAPRRRRARGILRRALWGRILRRRASRR
ncbi:hypothetical protein F4813DRAFT_391407 [Daldinia decipiens]|uniref:uncharacterized protein n=1 Tax=Daldinia decipiens TaxID=326647 RepID=UPI0020C22B4C|nr:uncharacterized protein F4813DRAFT_391407 [Daldinia decipiens]KAI1655835.1 hypothetical protein F4813DRAFT_391407 [Daldinia decipiens]